MEAATARLRILIVDDNDDIREPLCRVLAQHGFDLVSAPDGLKALRAVEESFVTQPFDAAIVDCAMPIMDGLTLLREIRQLEKRRPDARPMRFGVCTGHSNLISDTTLLEEANVERKWAKPNLPMPDEINAWLAEKDSG